MNFIYFIGKIWFTLRVYWSNIRWSKDLRNFQPVERIDWEKPYDSLYKLTKKLRADFHYTHDDYTQLFDAMHKPAQSYYNWLTDNFKDDCDGFHAAIYHILKHNNFNPVLINYITKNVRNSHTVVGCEWFNRYCIIDYTNIILGESLEDCLQKVLQLRRDKMIYYNLVKFNYSTNRYYVSK